MRIPLAATSALLSLCASLASQGQLSRAFRIELGLGAGEFDHRTQESSLDDDTDGGFGRLRFEGISQSGIGGGLRAQRWESDDDLFADKGFLASEGRTNDFYGHFTYRIDAGNFLMPIRIGIVYANYEIEEVVSGSGLMVETIGSRFEISPEYVFTRGRAIEWSIYGELGAGGGFASIDPTNTSTDFNSGAVLWGVEFGTRFRFGPGELGIAVVGQGIQVAESETKNSISINEFGAHFSGLVVTGAIVF